jgi:hypothetical protein
MPYSNTHLPRPSNTRSEAEETAALALAGFPYLWHGTEVERPIPFDDALLGVDWAAAVVATDTIALEHRHHQGNPSSPSARAEPVCEAASQARTIRRVQKLVLEG